MAHTDFRNVSNYSKIKYEIKTQKCLYNPIDIRPRSSIHLKPYKASHTISFFYTIEQKYEMKKCKQHILHC